MQKLLYSRARAASLLKENYVDVHTALNIANKENMIFPVKVENRRNTWHLDNKEISVFDPKLPDGHSEKVLQFHDRWK
jgi:hypothetical protein